MKSRNSLKRASTTMTTADCTEHCTHMSEYAEDAYWLNLLSLFGVTCGVYCEFCRQLLFGGEIPIINSPTLAHVKIYFGLTGCQKSFVKNMSFWAKFQFDFLFNFNFCLISCHNIQFKKAYFLGNFIDTLWVRNIFERGPE